MKTAPTKAKSKARNDQVRVNFGNTDPSKLGAWARGMRARYDTAQTTDDNYRHWAAADNLSASAANWRGVREVLRKRSRYEVANNTYAKGIVHTLANHTIGTGPRVQLQDVSRDTSKWFRAEWGNWAQEIGLAAKLRTMRMAKCQNGEAFGALTTNFNLDSEVKLDLRTIEADQIADPFWTQPDPKNIDGVMLDAFGNPEAYRVLKQHPGDMFRLNVNKYDTIPANSMIHWFTSDRDGQYRGVPEITSALPLFSQLRRYTLAVIAAAESAADAAGVIYSDAAADDQAATDPTPMETIELEKRMWMTMPRGWKIGQMKAEQPTTTYAEFKREIIKEIARCIQMPYNIAGGDSSDYNFASGRLDHEIYVTAIWIDRSECERVGVSKLIRAWFREAQLVEGYLPAELNKKTFPLFQIHWDALDLADPVKKNAARDIALSNGSATLVSIFAEDGLDAEDELQAEADLLDVPIEEYKKAIFNRRFTSANPAMIAMGLENEPPPPKPAPAPRGGRNATSAN